MFGIDCYRLSTVAGTPEPIYGPEALHSVSKTIADPSKDHKTDLTKEDLKWMALEYTSVETQTWYFSMDNGALGLAQVIYSNVAYVLGMGLGGNRFANCDIGDCTSRLSFRSSYSTHQRPMELSIRAHQSGLPNQSAIKRLTRINTRSTPMTWLLC